MKELRQQMYGEQAAEVMATGFEIRNDPRSDAPHHIIGAEKRTRQLARLS